VPSSSVRAFSDADDYAASIRATNATLTITQRGRFDAKLIRMDMHRMWMQKLSESLARVAYFSILPGRTSIAFAAQPGPIIISGGFEQDGFSIVRRNGGQEYFHRISAASCVCAMSLPVDEFTSLGTAIAGRDLTSATAAASVTPRPDAMAKLRELHATASHLAEYAPAVIARPEAARGLEQALIEAMVGCLDGGEVHEDTAARRQHALILRRFHRVIEEHSDRALYIPELCRSVGVSERTLRVCCEEQLGMSPKRFLLLRRMSLARRALRETTPLETTVTEIATRYGFWQFGRFAGEYKALFGELPSAMLARPPEERSNAAR